MERDVRIDKADRITGSQLNIIATRWLLHNVEDIANALEVFPTK